MIIIEFKTKNIIIKILLKGNFFSSVFKIQIKY